MGPGSIVVRNDNVIATTWVLTLVAFAYVLVVAVSDGRSELWPRLLLPTLIANALRVHLAASVLVTPDEVRFGGVAGRRHRMPRAEVGDIVAIERVALWSAPMGVAIEGRDGTRHALRRYGYVGFDGNPRDRQRIQIERLRGALGMAACEDPPA